MLKNKKNTYRLPITLVVFFSILAGIAMLIGLSKLGDSTVLRENVGETSIPDISDIQDVNTVTESDPFAALTIPYLRNRSYTSKLGERELLSTATRYERFITNYDSDGLQINALLTVPTATIPEDGWPAIVFIHGYIPPNQYRTQEKYEEYVDYLARNGFVVLKIDLRGHGNSEGTASGSYYSGDYIIDTLNARAALASSEFVNPDAIGLWGHSMAGNIVLRSVAAQQNIPAAVIWAGAVYTYEDFMEYGISDSSYQRPGEGSPRSQERQALFAEHGEFDASKPFWQSIVPTNYMEGVTTKLQLHHASNDSVVPIDYSTNLDQVLDSTEVDHEVFEYSSGGHNISGSSFSQAMQRTVDFFKEELQ